jgi:uncharacterized protein YqjF (DUF2071 family)
MTVAVVLFAGCRRRCCKGVFWSDDIDDLKERYTMQDIVRALLPKHPVAMRTVFRDCFLVNFAIEPQVLRDALPAAIEPDLHNGKAYLSIVIAAMERMRPAFLPAFLGVSYHQVVYRAVVRHRGERGVYFLRSDADNYLMSLAGDWLTFFRFHHSHISHQHEAGRVVFRLRPRDAAPAKIHAVFDLDQRSKQLPGSSNFATLVAAQEFLVELFTAFGADPRSGRVDRVHIKRGAWQIDVVPDLQAYYPLMQGSTLFPPGTAQLDSVFYAVDMPYYWHRLNRSGDRF